MSILLFMLIAYVHSESSFDNVFDDVSSCKATCRNTYTPHTFEKSTSEDCCNRGCRLFSMMEFIYDDLNKTLESCVDSCKEAYKNQDEFESCKMGCENQKPFALDVKDDMDSVQNIHLVNPFNYIHQMYASLVSNINMQQSWSSWMVYMRDSDGSIIVVKSPTSYKVDMGDSDDAKVRDEFNTASFIETNILPLDNSATPFLKNSQFNGQLTDDDIISLSQRDLSANQNGPEYRNSNDWLSCIASKTGLPRLILSWLLLMCAIVMIWLCLSAAVTGPEQRIVSEPQKLSINGDQEVIAELLANGIKPTYPQNEDEEPVISTLNIKVQRI